jgi:hypothetical protein
LDGGNSWELVHQFFCQAGSEPSPVGQIALAPDNPNRIYAAGGCAVAVSAEAGKPGSWKETRILSGRIAGTVWHIAVASAILNIGQRVYAAGDNQVWFSENGGQTWSKDKKFFVPPMRGESLPGAMAGISNGSSARILALEPGRPDHLFFAVPGLTNGPSYHHDKKEGPDGITCNLIKFADSDSNGIWTPNEAVVKDTISDNLYDSRDFLIAGRISPGQPLTTDRSGPFKDGSFKAAFKYVDSNGNNKWDRWEILIFDADDDGKYGLKEPLITGSAPAMGTALSRDRSGPGSKSLIKFVDANHDGKWNSGEIVAFDANDNGTYQGEPIAFGIAPPPGTPLASNPGGSGSVATFKFVDTNNDGAWDPGEAIVLDTNDDGRYYPDIVVAGESPAAGQSLKLPRPCGEASLWLGDYSRFHLNGSIEWTQLPGPPTYFGKSTPSGNTYVVTQQTSTGFLLFFSDRSHVHVSQGLPTSAASWHRLDGRNLSQAWMEASLENKLYVHVDPHSLVVSPDFTLTLKDPPRVFWRAGAPIEIPKVYRQNKISGGTSGVIWMANDGGVWHRSGANSKWRRAIGLSTLALVNLGGLAIRGRPPALYMGTGDNDDFYTLNGGRRWGDPVSSCGDCGEWFTDAARPTDVLSSVGREKDRLGGFALYRNRIPNQFPDPSKPLFFPPPITKRIRVVCPQECSFSYAMGSRPIVQTLFQEAMPNGLDFLVIGLRRDGTRVVFRKENSSAITGKADWENPRKAAQYGPPLPLCKSPSSAVCEAIVLSVVQASGGHAFPTVYVGDPSGSMTLWKWQKGITGDYWQRIVPSPTNVPADKSASIARRFFVSPYDPKLIYIIDEGNLGLGGIKRSEDGGQTWQIDADLDDAVTENGSFAYDGDGAVIKDMIFDRKELKTRFAVGNAGAFFTLDGNGWNQLFSTKAFPSRPIAAYFDPISDPNNRALYVGFAGRGVIRLTPIPFPPPIIGRTLSIGETASPGSHIASTPQAKDGLVE